jgi:hypothetical protein
MGAEEVAAAGEGRIRSVNRPEDRQKGDNARARETDMTDRRKRQKDGQRKQREVCVRVR